MKTYLITGATGYIGSMLIKKLKESDEACRITALVRDSQKAKAMFPTGVVILQADLSDGEACRKLKINGDFLIHCASVTKSAEMMSHPVEVTESIVNTTQNVLNLARRCGVKSIVYLSSMEVYGVVDCSDGHRVAETESGTIETLHARSCYPLGKRMAENICYSYYKEYGLPVKIARLAQTFGRGIHAGENRVFAQFARAVKEGRDIILHTAGDSMGNYCGIEDAVCAILLILEHGRDGEAYNVVNEENTMTIREMAMLAAEQAQGEKINVVYDIPDDDRYGYAADTELRLSGKKMAALGWKPMQSLAEMYLDVLEDMKTLHNIPETSIIKKQILETKGYMQMIRIGILGYGNLGRGVECAVKQNPDMELAAVFTRRNPADVKILTEGASVCSISEAPKWKDKIDVLILCGGSATDLPEQTPIYAELFHVVDSFDTHARIPEHFANVDEAAKKGGKVGIISVGWDPGMFSLNRMYANAILPDGKDYTFWGKGVSQGHSDAIRRVADVKDAKQYTVPVQDALDAVRNGENPDLTTRQKHTRECFVVLEDGADAARVEEEIKTMPNYFADYDTTVHFISQEELEKNHSGIPHGGFVLRSGKTGWNHENNHLIEYRLRLDSNPEFTSCVLVAYARAAYRLGQEGVSGCKTVFDIAPAYLSSKDGDELRASLL